MPSILIGRHGNLTHTRYNILLSNSKRIVLFRLPIIVSARREEATARRPNESSDWTYYAMEAECPHAGGPMGDAQIDIEDSSYVASCPWHAYVLNSESS